MVAEVLFQAILVPTVTYTPALGYSQYVSIVGGTKNDTLGYRTLKLLNETVRESNVWGQPSTVWKLDTAATFGCWSKPTTTDKTLVSFADTPVASYTCLLYTSASAQIVIITGNRVNRAQKVSIPPKHITQLTAMQM